MARDGGPSKKLYNGYRVESRRWPFILMGKRGTGHTGTQQVQVSSMDRQPKNPGGVSRSWEPLDDGSSIPEHVTGNDSREGTTAGEPGGLFVRGTNQELCRAWEQGFNWQVKARGSSFT